MADAPDPQTGPVEGLQRAMANAPEAAMQGLERAHERVQEMYQEMMQNTNQVVGEAGDFVREGMPDVAGQAASSVAPVAIDAISHLPEVST